ncbi:MAG: hypothetical protein V7696_05890 [Halioglobus sp.]
MIRSKPSHRQATGYALISVLWLVALLSVIATGLAYASRQHILTVSSVVSGTKARYLADGAAQLVLANLLSQIETDRLLADGETVELTLPGGVVEISVYDEYGKIDLNRASTSLLARFLYSLDVEPAYADALADAIADYRDEDDLKHLNGAEDEDYIKADLAWESKDSKLASVDELRRVYGMTEQVFEVMRPHVTVHTSKRGVNPEVASLQVLMAISDDSPQSLEHYIEQRRLNHRDGLPLPPAPHVQRQYLLKRRGTVYTVQARGKSEAGIEAGTTTTFSLRRSQSRPQINTLDWQPYVRAEITLASAHDNVGDRTGMEE